MGVYLDLASFWILLAVSFVACGILFLRQEWFSAAIQRRNDLGAVQAAHVRPVLRIGGVGVIASVYMALLFFVPGTKRSFFALFSATLAPVFAAGLAEDLGWRVSARGRLIAAAASSVLAIVLLQIWIPPVGLPWLDVLLGVTPFAIVLTVLWSTGICHAFNLIDGVNGLAGGTGLLIAAGLAIIANEVGAAGFATVAAALIPALAGFLLFNWPLGRIFLGDAGAYTLGHLLFWLALGLLWHYPEVSGVAISLLFFWPMADTILAIARRLSNGKPVAAPDRLHFHQFAMRVLLMLFRGRIDKGTANSLTALVLLPFIAVPIATAVMLWDRPYAALLAWAVYGALFAATYLAGVRFFRSGRWRTVARRHNRRPV